MPLAQLTPDVPPFPRLYPLDPTEADRAVNAAEMLPAGTVGDVLS